MSWRIIIEYVIIPVDNLLNTPHFYIYILNTTIKGWSWWGLEPIAHKHVPIFHIHLVNLVPPPRHTQLFVEQPTDSHSVADCTLRRIFKCLPMNLVKYVLGTAVVFALWAKQQDH